MESPRGWAEFADSLPVIAWRSQPDGTVERWNAQWFATTGASAATPLTDWTDKLHPDDRSAWPSALRQSCSQPMPFRGAFRVWSLAHEEYRLHEARVAPQRDGEGRIASWSGVAIDIEERVPDARLQALQDSLGREQEELRLFAYGASHDLREPVRMVQSYAELLMRRHGEALDGQGREYLGFTLQGAERLRRLTDDLLTYSRVSGSDEFVRKRVRMAGVVQWAMMNLKQAIEESGASIEWDGLPPVMADENRIVLVVQNLLSNSLKFRRPGHPPRVQVTAEQAEGEAIFRFADNGTGFDPRFADQVFSAFKRLHGREYPGSGLGLAIASKIVERHGGRIWAQSTPGEGSQFYFSLPD